MRFGLIASLLFAQIGVWICVDPSWARPCVVPPVTAEAINEFKSNPSAIIAPDSDTRTVEAVIRDLAGTDASIAVDLVRFAQATTPRFRTAVAAGLAQAAVACNNSDQQAALLIQQAVASFDDSQFQAAFAAALGDLSTAATEAATAFASGAVGSVVTGNPNTGRKLSTSLGGSGSIALVQITSGAVTTDSALPGTNTAANPVSPTR
jgi:hypothetical protein